MAGDSAFASLYRAMACQRYGTTDDNFRFNLFDRPNERAVLFLHNC